MDKHGCKGGAAMREKTDGAPPSPTMGLIAYGKRIPIGRGRIRKLSKTEGFPAIFVGKKTLVLVNEADAWLSSCIGKRI